MEELLERVRKAARAYMLAFSHGSKRIKLRELNEVITEAKLAGVDEKLINAVICEELMRGHA